jgi:predicted permease
MQHVRFGLRQLRRNPGFATVAILTLALGIGANTAIFSVLQTVVLAPLPYQEPDRLALVLLNNFNLKSTTYLSFADFLDWQREARSFEQMSANAGRGYDLSSPGTPEHLQGREISAGFFSILGVKPVQGREFTTEEDRVGGTPSAVVSGRLAQDRFGSSAGAVGKPLVLDGVETTIVGVLPRGFRFGTAFDADVYTPIGQRKLADRIDRTAHDVACVARLKPGVTIGQADAEMNAIQENIDRLNPQTESGLGASVMPLKEATVGDVRGLLLLLLGAVGVVLLIACANVANLLLSRAAGRKRELSIRAALGAERGDIVRQLLTESVLLSVLGGALGLAIAKWGLDAALPTIASNLPRHEDIRVNVWVLLFTLTTSIVVGVLFGLLPALKSSRPDLLSTLKEGGRGSAGGHKRAQSTLIVVQMALTLVLLSGAGLLFRTIQHLWKVSLGFDPQNIIAFQVGLSPSATRSGDGVRAAFQQLVERIRELPGVQGADLTTLVPMSHESNDIPFWVDHHQPPSVAEAPRTLGFITGPDFQRLMGIPLLKGRYVNAHDTIDSPRVAVIDSELAHAYFPNQDPVGRTITFPQVGDYRIVGVVGHVQHWQIGLSNPFFRYQSYVSIYQITDRWSLNLDTWTWVVVRTPQDPSAVLPEIRKTLFGAGSDQTLYHAQTMRTILSDSMSAQQFPLILLGAFAGVALLLACVGIYGVFSYSVAQRIQEIGIRMALGADRGDVLQMIIVQALRLAALAIGIGVAAALLLGKLLSSFSQLLYGVRANDPVTLTSVSLILTAVSILACYLPARRAAKVDPMISLRQE